jgi:DNA-binding NarL/FixJ family response regulator
MSKTGIGLEPPAGSVVAMCGRVALVGLGAERAQIGGVLEREALDFDTFADAESLLCEPDGECEPGLIVLWVQDTLSRLADCIEPLTRRFTQAPLIMVCPSIERWEVRAALAAGAAGVVLSEKLDSALGPVLHAVRAGQLCVPRVYRRQIEPPVLSSREKQILGLVVMSYTNGQIARQLFLAESTVKSHLSSAFGKLGVRSRNEAVNLILDPDRGLGMGILGLGGEPLASGSSGTPSLISESR